MNAAPSREVRLVPMTQDRFTAWRRLAVSSYAGEKERAEQLSPDDARILSETSFQKLLPQGVETPEHFLFLVYDAMKDEEVATLWLALRGQREPRVMWVYDILVNESQRGQGYGEATMRAAEDFSRSKGCPAIELHVFGHNPVARKLYEKIGFEPTSIVMRKKITPPRPA